MKKSPMFSPLKSGNKKFAKKRLHDDRNWTEYSVQFLQHNPKCYACGERARVTDHVVSAKGDEKKFWDTTNLIPLCKKCHDVLTATFDRHVVPKTEEKMQWIAAKRVETDTTTKVKIVPFKR